MAFKKRKADRRKLDAPIFSGAAEVCETRALLSADGICLPAVDADAVVIEDIEATDSEEVVDVDATVEDGEFIPELAICTMMVPFAVDGAVDGLGGFDGGDVVNTDGTLDPSLMYCSVMPSDTGDGTDFPLIACEDYPVFKGDVTDLGTNEEQPVNDSEVPLLNPLDPLADDNLAGADPTVIRFIALDASESTDGEVTDPAGDGEVKVKFWHDLAPAAGEDVVVDVADETVDVTTLEDFDPSWAYRTFTSAPSGEDDGSQLIDPASDGEVKVQNWHDLAPGSEEDIVVDGTDETVDVTTLEDFDPSWAYRGTVVDGEEVTEDVIDEKGADGTEVVEETTKDGEEVVAVEDGGVIPIRYSFGDNFRGPLGGDIPVEVLAMASGAPAADSTPSVMGPVAGSTPAVAPVVNIPVVVNQPSVIPTVVSPSLSIPVNQGGFSPLFGKEEELLVTTLAPVASEIETLVSEVEESVSSGLGSDFGDLIGSSSDNSDAPVGELTPIFGEEQDEEESEEVPAAEDAPIETDEPVSSVEVPQQPVMVASRTNYGRSIDEFMSEFAMSGFAG